jgi:hypothetical protein
MANENRHAWRRTFIGSPLWILTPAKRRLLCLDGTTLLRQTPRELPMVLYIPSTAARAQEEAVASADVVLVKLIRRSAAGNERQFLFTARPDTAAANATASETTTSSAPAAAAGGANGMLARDACAGSIRGGSG